MVTLRIEIEFSDISKGREINYIHCGPSIVLANLYEELSNVARLGTVHLMSATIFIELRHRMQQISDDFVNYTNTRHRHEYSGMREQLRVRI